MNLLKQLNLLLSFLLELVLLFLVGYWGFHIGEKPLLNYMLALALPVVVAVIWGIWAAPKSARRLKNPAREMLKLALFFAGAGLAYLAEKPAWAVLFVVAVAANAVFAFQLKQDY